MKRLEAEEQGRLDEDGRKLSERYAVSWYADVDRIDPEKSCEPSKVPIASGSALVDAMQENVDQAKRDRNGIRTRYERAQREGLFDLVALKKIDDTEVREAWLASIETMKGDKGRCIAEVAHWRNYLKWAMSGDAKVLAGPLGGGTLVRSLAEAKSITSEDETVIRERENAARNKIAADLAEWKARNPEPDRRLPPEADDDPPF